MNKTYLSLAGVFALIIVVAIGYRVTADKPQTAASPAPSTMAMNGTGTMGTNAVQTTAIAIDNYEFKTANASVKVGATVTWTNNDAVSHTVTVDSGDGPKSPLFGRDKTYSYTFTKAGTYSYHCEPHPYMKAKITVTQ